jgi:hypothetical protein
MLILSNDAVAVTADESGRELTLHDRRRGTRWALDEASVHWCDKLAENEYYFDGLVRDFKPMIPRGARLEKNELILAFSAGECPVEYRYRLLEDGVELRLIPAKEGPIKALSMPGAFFPLGETKKLLLPIMQGMLWDGRGESFAHLCRSGSHSGFSMMMYGVLGRTGGLLAAAETAVDSFWWYQKDERGFRVQNMQDASLGDMGYERVLRLYLTDPAIVPLAKGYRRRVMEKGRFLSWEEKLRERPGLERIFGALMCYLGYCGDDLDYVAELAKLKAYGFDRALVYPVGFNCYDQGFLMGGQPPIALSKEAIDQIKAMGYDVSPWSWINEAIDDGSARRGALYRVDRRGERDFGWQIDGAKWYRVCSGAMYEKQREALSGEFRSMSWDHFDVLTCAGIGECYAKDHPTHPGQGMSRGQSLEWIRKTLVAGQDVGGRGSAVSSENFNDLFFRECDIGSVKAWPQYGPWSFWPVPLTGLVYHDSMLHSWWEVHSYNCGYFNRALGPNLLEYGGGRPDLQAAADALMGCPPDVFPFGAQYAWTGRGAETKLFRFRFEEPSVQYALSRALPVARLHRRVGRLEMTDFEILSEDGWVQRSAFADGTEVVANFGHVPRSDIKGVEPLDGQRWIAR